MESISKLTIQPLEFIWVNDHSEDNSLVLLQSLPKNHIIISLATSEIGKKSAIRQGIQHSKGEFILTWDADITVPSTYFDELKKTPSADLLILPVKMVGNTLLEYFYELDYYFLSSINVALCGFKKPIIASGANLLFKKTSFLEVDSIEHHQHIPSGDDQFLLVDFKKAKKSIQVITEHALCVTTTTPHSLKKFFQQRIRCIGKSANIKDKTTTIIGLIGIIYTILYVYLLFTTNWDEILSVKITCDILIFLPYLNVLKRKFISVFIPLFCLLYPIYFCLIGIQMYFIKPKWKGRRTRMKR